MKHVAVVFLFFVMLLFCVEGLCAGSHDGALDAAFDEDRLMLRKIDASDLLGETVLDENAWAVTGETPAIQGSIQLGKAIEDGMARLWSLSPQGNSGLATVGEHAALTLYDGSVHVIYPSYERSVPDEYDNLQRMAKEDFRIQLGDEGVVYSHDGKYAAVFHSMRILATGKYYYDPALIDLSTGEMFLTATYPAKFRGEARAAAPTTGCFSSDDRYFYYILFSSSRDDEGNALYRYDMETKKTEFCCNMPYSGYLPKLSQVAENKLILLGDGKDMHSRRNVIEVTEKEGKWQVEAHEISMQPDYFKPRMLSYSDNSGFAFMTGNMSMLPGGMAFMAFRPGENNEGFNQYFAIQRGSQAVRNVDSAMMQSAAPKASAEENQQTLFDIIYKSTLSPDGFYVLMLTGDNAKVQHLYMMRLETSELKAVHGMDPTTILAAETPGNDLLTIEWNSDTLIVQTEHGTELYQFDY